MCGKRPKDRDCYVLRMGDGTLVEVTREVYLEWYQSRRREKYQQERNQKHGVCSLDELEESGNFSNRTVNLKNELEETVLRNLCNEKLYIALKRLSEQEAYLIQLLYFDEVTVKEAAQLCGCSRKTIQNRRKKVLSNLSGILQEEGIQGGSF